MLASPLPPSFLDTYSLSTSSLGCNALCMVISFLVLWSICLSSSRVHLRKGPEYLTSGTAQVFIPLMRFLLESFFSSSFRVLLRYSFRILLLLLLFYSLESFPLHRELMVFHWSLSNSKSPQIFRTLFSILDDLNNAVFWMVSSHPLISKSSSPFINPLVTVQSAPITIDINVRLYASLWVFLFSGPLVGVLLWSTLRMIPSILRGVQPRYLSLWWDF